MNSAIPSISVIIPAFNEESYLPSTLQSVNQSASALLSGHGINPEVIVVDNASTDATAKVAASLGARVIHEPEHNIARVRNRGAAAAGGDALVFLDADTLIPVELLPRIHQIMAEPRCAGGAVDTDYQPKKRSVRAYLGLWRILGKALGMAQGAAQFCRRDAFTAVGGYDESILMGEDVDFYWRLKRHARGSGGQVRFIDELRVAPSCRRFDQWSLWRTLVWTNPLVIAPLRRVRSAWRAWYDTPFR